MAVISDDHNAEAGEAALRQIVAMVSQIGGPEALEDLTVELALKVAELVEQIASDQHLPAADVADILFID
jgi:chemotaxis response regulator CheB